MLTQARLSEIATQLHVAATWLPKGSRANTLIIIADELDDASAVGANDNSNGNFVSSPSESDNPYVQDSDTAGAHDEDEQL